MDHLPKRGEALQRIGIALALFVFVIWYLLIRPKTGRSAETQLDEDMRALMRNVELYADWTGNLPRSLQKLVDPEDGMRKLAATLPMDPWGRPYRIEVTGHDYAILSDGADLETGTADDTRVSGTWVPKKP